MVSSLGQGGFGCFYQDVLSIKMPFGLSSRRGTGGIGEGLHDPAVFLVGLDLGLRRAAARVEETEGLLDVLDLEDQRADAVGVPLKEAPRRPALADRLDGVENATVAVREWEGEVIFLHEVRAGAADRSYGVQVAKLAGLPSAVVERARVILDELERGDREGGGRTTALIDDLPLFAAAPPAPPAAKAEPSQVEAHLATVLPDDLTPREALQVLYELKALAKDTRT